MEDEIGKDDCPICREKNIDTRNLQCYICMTCKQKIHSLCELTWNTERKLTNRLLKDDILLCPICIGDSIAYCSQPDIDINEDIKIAVRQNPNRRGGKINKYKKIRKHKTRTTRTTRKTRRTRTRTRTRTRRTRRK
jgi:hypothetical protein